MKNEFKHINKYQASILLKKFKKKEKSYVAVINGQEIQNEKEWLCAISESLKFPVYSKDVGGYIDWYPTAFKYPSENVEGWDGFSDWITDLGWIKSETIYLFILNYKNFLCQNPNVKKQVVINFGNL